MYNFTLTLKKANMPEEKVSNEMNYESDFYYSTLSYYNSSVISWHVNCNKCYLKIARELFSV